MRKYGSLKILWRATNHQVCPPKHKILTHPLIWQFFIKYKSQCSLQFMKHDFLLLQTASNSTPRLQGFRPQQAQDSKLLVSLMQWQICFPSGWSGSEIDCTVIVDLPKWAIHYHKVASSNMSCLEAPEGFFQIAYEGDFRFLCTVTF